MTNGSMMPALPDGRNLSPLTLEESRVIAALLDFPTISEALAFAGVTTQWHGWHIRKSPAYAEAVKRIGESLLTEARAKLDSLMPKVAETFEEAIDTDKALVIDATCPACQHEFIVTRLVPDLKTRLSVARDLLKRSGDLAPKLKVEAEVKHRDMSLEDKLALAQVQRGLPIPPDVFASLKDRGLLPANLPIHSADTGRPGEAPEPLPEVRYRAAQSNWGTEDSNTLEGDYKILPPQEPADR